jgi:hypothetical protein
MYKIIMRKYWKDGTFTETESEPNRYKEFKEAAKYADMMNNHIWRFHQDQAATSFHYVKEI